jgi:DNA-binding helix-hairpin-helix protein with protein kinase domain
VKLRDSGGSTLTIARKIGEGGEGAVFTTNEQRGVVAKLYTQPLQRGQVAKLETMIRAGDPTLASVAAWPLALVFEGVRPVGFTMPLLAGQHPLHDLVGPKRRQELFPDAHWNFLVHAGLNLARAFEILHARDVVVGDVNSNNVVVHRNALTHLIDCDSFQIRASGALYRCTVGVAEYQPPEFQGKDLSRLDRSPQHDLFGLAVMIFQLLFVGKHPFAGVLPAAVRATGAIGDNVAARRFFYGPEAKRLGLKPPPGSIGLSAVTPGVALAFRQAFLGDPAARPSAAAWVAALHELQTKTVPCRSNAAHRYRAGSACPWCALEKRGLNYFSLPLPLGQSGGLDDSVWRTCTDADVERMWAEIAAVVPPAPRSPVTAPARHSRTTPARHSRTTPARQYRTTPLGLWKRKRIAGFAAGAIALSATLGLLIAAGQPGFAAIVLLVGALAGLAARPDARQAFAQRRRRLEAARKAYAAAEKEWARAARATGFVEMRARLAQVRRALKEQRRRYEAEIAVLRKNREREALRRYLESHVIAVNLIPEIDKRAKAMLLSFGIETADEIEAASLREVPQLTRMQRARLVMWRESIERSFRTQPRQALDAKAVRDIETRHVSERLKHRAELASGAALLRQIAHDLESRRPALERQARERAEAYRQAEADMRITPLLYRTLIFS